MSTVRSPHVVDGEAPESDEENPKAPPQAIVVAGEASESEDEADQSSASGTTETKSNQYFAASSSGYTESILHRKLYENNVALRASVLGLFRGAVDNAYNKLSLVDQDLLNSQLRMQSAAALVTNGRQMMMRTSACLKDAVSLSGNTLPPMKPHTNKT